MNWDIISTLVMLALAATFAYIVYDATHPKG
uniref:Uncharacterized protein n=1 Tax=Candidatus Kentrum sp. DK TaxID=2126562 RepID=A0A450RTG3_9GAMM|nr:MAG: hypothetical protein BECKDK2373B_GA0170837_100164 [Candidatus Kentron sp. DK]VFJ48086.1 MAG: hypothetical protein BECKDK2373C_GA0170839_10204 [Candidatus Kentron sp. DK]